MTRRSRACSSTRAATATIRPIRAGRPISASRFADYRKYVKPDATAADVRAMSVDEAKAIYRKHYWDAQRCDELPAGVDYSVFDYGVNSGIGRSGKVLRRVVGLPDNTSVVTDQVLAYARVRRPQGAGRRDLRRAARLPEIAQDLAGVRPWLGHARGRGEVFRAAAGRRCGGAADSAPRRGPATGKGAVPVSKTAQQRWPAPSPPPAPPPRRQAHP